jgi:hypothetical protein
MMKTLKVGEFMDLIEKTSVITSGYQIVETVYLDGVGDVVHGYLFNELISPVLITEYRGSYSHPDGKPWQAVYDDLYDEWDFMKLSARVVDDSGKELTEEEIGKLLLMHTDIGNLSLDLLKAEPEVSPYMPYEDEDE